jgi:hypothetical protein
MHFNFSSHNNGAGRSGGSVVGAILGLFMVLGSCGLLWWNEWRAVQTTKALEEGERAVVSVESTSVDPAHDGHLIHTSGDALTQETLKDSLFGIQFTTQGDALRLQRKVEMYQWEERSSSSSSSNSNSRTYSYSKVWQDSLISSSSFHHSGYNNPSQMPFPQETFDAQHIRLGAFSLSPSLIRALDAWRPFLIDNTSESNALGFTKTADNTFYKGRNANDPEIGDVRVSFSFVPPGPVSVVARQDGSSFSPYTSANGREVELLEHGTVSAQTMFAHAHSDNTVLTWVLRFVGWLFCLIGFVFALSILRVLTSMLPFVDGIVGAGIGLVSFVVASALSLVVVAVAWLLYHPVAGLILLAVAAAICFPLVRKGVKAARSAAASSLSAAA